MEDRRRLMYAKKHLGFYKKWCDELGMPLHNAVWRGDPYVPGTVDFGKMAILCDIISGLRRIINRIEYRERRTPSSPSREA